jgi:hypothetical protein
MMSFLAASVICCFLTAVLLCFRAMSVPYPPARAKISMNDHTTGRVPESNKMSTI